MNEEKKKEHGAFYDHIKETKKKSKKDPTPVIGAVFAILLLVLLAILVIFVLPYTRINLLELMRRARMR